MEHFTLHEEQKKKLRAAGAVLCYLHGSAAAGSLRKDSDIDVAVLFGRTPNDPVKATNAVLDALSDFLPKREIDIAILNTASPLLAQRVAARGALLFERDPGEAFRFALRAMHEYESSRRIAKIGRAAARIRAGF